MSAINRKVLTSWGLFVLAFLYFLQVSFMEDVENEASVRKKRDTRRPIWNIAHMANSKDSVKEKIDEGANSLEFDIQFNKKDEAFLVKHDCPVDPGSDCFAQADFVEYIKHMRKLTSPDSTNYYRKRLVLLIMDVKLSSSPSQWKTAGTDIAEKLLKHYWQKGKSGAKAYIILCVPEYKQMDFITSFRKRLKKSRYFKYYDKRIGYDFSSTEDLEEIESAYEKADIKKNIWQSHGLNAFGLPLQSTMRLIKALEKRNNNTSYFNKVYWWTVNPKEYMMEALWWGVDGIITNYPKRLKEVLNETSEFRRSFRLATLDDNPWETFT